MRVYQSGRHGTRDPVKETGNHPFGFGSLVGIGALKLAREILSRYNGVWFYDFDVPALVFLNQVLRDREQKERQLEEQEKFRQAIESWSIWEPQIRLSCWQNVNQNWQRVFHLLQVYGELYPQYGTGKQNATNQAKQGLSVRVADRKFWAFIEHLKKENRILPAKERIYRDFRRQSAFLYQLQTAYRQEAAQRKEERENLLRRQKVLRPERGDRSESERMAVLPYSRLLRELLRYRTEIRQEEFGPGEIRQEEKSRGEYRKEEQKEKNPKEDIGESEDAFIAFFQRARDSEKNPDGIVTEEWYHSLEKLTERAGRFTQTQWKEMQTRIWGHLFSPDTEPDLYFEESHVPVFPEKGEFVSCDAFSQWVQSYEAVLYRHRQFADVAGIYRQFLKTHESTDFAIQKEFFLQCLRNCRQQNKRFYAEERSQRQIDQILHSEEGKRFGTILRLREWTEEELRLESISEAVQKQIRKFDRVQWEAMTETLFRIQEQTEYAENTGKRLRDTLRFYQIWKDIKSMGRHRRTDAFLAGRTKEFLDLLRSAGQEKHLTESRFGTRNEEQKPVFQTEIVEKSGKASRRMERKTVTEFSQKDLSDFVSGFFPRLLAETEQDFLSESGLPQARKEIMEEGQPPEWEYPDLSSAPTIEKRQLPFPKKESLKAKADNPLPEWNDLVLTGISSGVLAGEKPPERAGRPSEPEVTIPTSAVSVASASASSVLISSIPAQAENLSENSAKTSSGSTVFGGVSEAEKEKQMLPPEEESLITKTDSAKKPKQISEIDSAIRQKDTAEENQSPEWKYPVLTGISSGMLSGEKSPERAGSRPESVSTLLGQNESVSSVLTTIVSIPTVSASPISESNISATSIPAQSESLSEISINGSIGSTALGGDSEAEKEKQMLAPEEEPLITKTDSAKEPKPMSEMDSAMRRDSAEENQSPEWKYPILTGLSSGMLSGEKSSERAGNRPESVSPLLGQNGSVSSVAASTVAVPSVLESSISVSSIPAQSESVSKISTNTLMGNTAPGGDSKAKKQLLPPEEESLKTKTDSAKKPASMSELNLKPGQGETAEELPSPEWKYPILTGLSSGMLSGEKSPERAGNRPESVSPLLGQNGSVAASTISVSSIPEQPESVSRISTISINTSIGNTAPDGDSEAKKQLLLSEEELLQTKTDSAKEPASVPGSGFVAGQSKAEEDSPSPEWESPVLTGLSSDMLSGILSGEKAFIAAGFLREAAFPVQSDRFSELSAAASRQIKTDISPKREIPILTGILPSKEILKHAASRSGGRLSPDPQKKETSPIHTASERQYARATEDFRLRKSVEQCEQHVQSLTREQERLRKVLEERGQGPENQRRIRQMADRYMLEFQDEMRLERMRRGME